MDASRRARLEQVYSEHPVTAAAVIARVRAERGTLVGLRARDLTEAAHGGPTDQNHVGGAATVRALAIAVGLRASWSVLDVGAGLGGASRLLAEEHGCRCHGVELTAGRYRDALALTRLAGLESRVTFTAGDFMDMPVPGGPYDLAICLGAAMHFPYLDRLLRKIASHVRPGGRLAIEDGVLTPAPWTSDDRDALSRLERCWHGAFQLRGAWPGQLDAAGFRVDAIDDLTALAVHDFEDQLADDVAGRLGEVAADERLGWELGLRLIAHRRLEFVRIVATRVMST
jgi:SAM-dependent methyltransferase